MVIACWSFKRVTHYSFLPQGKTIRTTSLEIECMYEKIEERNIFNLWIRMFTFCYTVARFSINCPKADSLNYEILHHSPYSPDIFPIGYHLFQHFSFFICNIRFTNKKEVIETLKMFITWKDETFFHDGIKNLELRWRTMIHQHGAYFN